MHLRSLITEASLGTFTIANAAMFLHADISTKACIYNVDSFKPYFYNVKLGFAEVNIIFLIGTR